MATYYRWRKSTPKYTDFETKADEFILGPFHESGYHHDIVMSNGNTYHTDGIYYILDNEYSREVYSYDSVNPGGGSYFQYVVTPPTAGKSNIMYKASGSSTGGRIYVDDANNVVYFAGQGREGTKYTRTVSPGTPQGYVYSTSSSAYPNGGVSGSYYYDQRTTVTSPTAPTNLTYPNPITTPTVTVNWQAATSNTDYPVTGYNLYYGKNGDESTTNIVYPQNNPNTSAEVQIPSDATSIRFWVGARDSNGTVTVSEFGPWVSVYLAPTLTIPQMVMQGQPATISWSEVDGADSYTLQRKSSADTDWTQVYSGANLSYTETVGTWTSLQYRVQAVFDGTGGGWATSDSIQIVSASALVISGTDGDLGTLVNDVPYSISSDQTSPTIDVTVEVNGGEYASFQATSGQTYKVGVLDLPTGTGSIVITASTEVSSSPVSVTRTWTYSKTAQTFPSAGSVGQLTQEGAVVWPETLAEAVRAGTPWGGNLSTALELLKRAALFNRTQQPKYSEVTISLSGKTEGQIIQLPENGRMVEFYVAKLDYESVLNGAGRVLLVRKECYDKRAWDAGNVNAYATSDIDTWLNGDYKALFPTEIQTAMGTTTFYYTPGNGNTTVGTLARSVFLLSFTELGKTYTAANVEGTTLNIANTLTIAYYNGSPVTQWTRTPNNASPLIVMCTDTSGAIASNRASTDIGCRPVFTLPSTFTYGPVYMAQDGTIHASQEYTEAGDWLDVWGNAIPAVKIETGSYVGTGTYGESNPNTLTFGFEPKLVFIATENQENVINRVATAPLIFGTNFSSIFYVTSSPTLLEGTIYLQWDKNAIEFYNAGSASRQLNSAGETYRYVALG